MSLEGAFIAVEGPIGAGKTTLASLLAERLNASLLLERAEDNPFLPRFYREPRAAAFPAQLHFLFQRAGQMAALRQQEIFHRTQVSDFMIEKDRLFARLNLDDDEYDLYEKVYARLSIDAPDPDLVLLLQAPVPVLQDRIRQRGIDFEQGIGEEYLSRLSRAYIDLFRHYTAAPVLVVNTESVNFAEREGAVEDLLKRMTAMRPGRQYFNPATASELE